MLMSITLTRKIANFYVAYAPDSGAYSYGGCFEEAVNDLADEIRQRQVAAENTGKERKHQDVHD